VRGGKDGENGEGRRVGEGGGKRMEKRRGMPEPAARLLSRGGLLLRSASPRLLPARQLPVLSAPSQTRTASGT
jgi:hypothetical protein